jgi:hypothetical protein
MVVIKITGTQNFACVKLNPSHGHGLFMNINLKFDSNINFTKLDNNAFFPKL